VVGHRDDELAVLRRGEPDVTVGAAAVVIARDPPPAPRGDRQDRVQRRADLAGEDPDLVDLALARREGIVIDVAGRPDHPVEGHRRGERRRRLGGVIGLGLQGVAEGAEAEGVGIGGGPAPVPGDQAEVPVGLRRQGQAGGRLAEDVADPADGHRLADLAPRGDGRRRPGEIPDVEPVEAVGVARVGALAGGDDVRAILGRDYRDEPVLPDEGRVVAGRQLEPPSIQDRHVRVEERQPQPDPLDLRRDPLPLPRPDRIIIDVLPVGDAVDGDVHGDRLGAREVAVRLRLGHLLQRADAERPEFGDPGGRAKPEVVQPERGVGVDPEGRGDHAILARLDPGGRDPGPVEQDLAGVGQPLPAQAHRDLGTPPAADRLDATDGRTGRRNRRGDDHQDKRGGEGRFHGGTWG